MDQRPPGGVQLFQVAHLRVSPFLYSSLLSFMTLEDEFMKIYDFIKVGWFQTTLFRKQASGKGRKGSVFIFPAVGLVLQKLDHMLLYQSSSSNYSYYGFLFHLKQCLIWGRGIK